MRIDTRFADYGKFLEIKVDEIETHVWPNDGEDLETNLFDAIQAILHLKDKNVFQFLEEQLDVRIHIE